MGIIRPATPGFLVTLVATGLLAVVSFSVPWFKSIFFLKASLAVEGINGSVTFGTLGYCLELPNGTTCSKPSVGYELNINQLVGDNTKIQIPQVVVKWITYTLVLHIVALVLAGISAIFGLLAHVRELSMTCCSTCVSGFGAAIALLAFIFDLAFFFIAKSRINAVKGGSAVMGNAIWLTLAAWILLFFSGCFYGLGRCCVRRRPRDGGLGARQGSEAWMPPARAPGPTYEEQMRLDAIKAEADRKARQKQGEVGLPAFQEYDPTQPLTLEEEEQHALPYRDNAGGFGRRPSQPNAYAGGYAQAPPGTRAVDEYYAPSNQQNLYPPQPRREPTAASGHTQQSSGYAPSNYPGATAITTDAAVGGHYVHEQYPTNATGQYGHEQYPSNTGYASPPVPNNAYVPAIGHQEYPTSATTYQDPFHSQYAPPPEPPLNTETYNRTGLISSPSPPHQPQAQAYVPPGDPTSFYAPHASPPQRSYTLGGGGYGANVVPALHEPQPEPPASANSYLTYPGGESPTSPRGPRTMQQPVQEPVYEDSPPTYDAGTAPPPGRYTAKR
ncbi:pali-domain-containing protein [Artomyces pyxidatus]|uniref:Pali-domain-containing protein n=1 Tax=Artomyces pyxidatus TaxID=48021 RepID=A0ACB8TBX5_9AGAM|nr:pali-domain-containing protein [Artomyces pyxidatus]